MLRSLGPVSLLLLSSLFLLGACGEERAPAVPEGHTASSVPPNRPVPAEHPAPADAGAKPDTGKSIDVGETIDASALLGNWGGEAPDAQLGSVGLRISFGKRNRFEATWTYGASTLAPYTVQGTWTIQGTRLNLTLDAPGPDDSHEMVFEVHRTRWGGLQLSRGDVAWTLERRKA